MKHNKNLQYLDQTEDSRCSASTSNSIGILDLSGFENFVDNSFEQMCINVANEKLQYFFNTFIFATEQAIYAEEGIDWSQIEFQNNEVILRMFLGDDDSATSGNKRSFRVCAITTLCTGYIYSEMQFISKTK